MDGRILLWRASGIQSFRGRKFTAMAAVEVINQQSDDQPQEEPNPGEHRQSRHQQYAKYNAQDRDDRTTRTTETAVPLWIFVTKDNDADRDQHKREKCTDIGKVGEGADIQQSSGESHRETGDPCSYRRRAKAGMH